MITTHLKHITLSLALTTCALSATAQDKPTPPTPQPKSPPAKSADKPVAPPADTLKNLNSLDDLLAPTTQGAPKPATPAQPVTQDKTANDLDSLLGLPTTTPNVKSTPDGAGLKIESATGGNAGAKNIFDDLMNIPENDGGDDFDSAVQNMTQAAARLTNNNDLSLDTQRHQQSAILNLDKMIAELNKQQSSKKKQKKQQKKDEGEEGNESKPSQPGEPQQQQMSDATEQAGKQGQVEEGELNGDAPLAEKLAEWGNLPPHLRDELMQGFEDRFSELYRHLTEQYYKRLAEESQ